MGDIWLTCDLHGFRTLGYTIMYYTYISTLIICLYNYVLYSNLTFYNPQLSSMHILQERKKSLLFNFGNRIYSSTSFQPGRAPHFIILTKTPTVSGSDLNPRLLSLEDSALLTELMRPDT